MIMELELVGKCGCNCSESSSDNCFCLICLAIVVVALIVIAFIGYLAYSKYLSTKLKMAENERELKKNEFEEKMKWEGILEGKLTDHKKEDLDRAIKCKLADAIIEKVKDSDVDLESAIAKVDELQSKLLEHSITEQ